MKNSAFSIAMAAFVLASIVSCNKSDRTGNNSEEMTVSDISSDSSATTTDMISSTADLKVKDKKFVKTAAVEMEVKDVYDATVSIEKILKDLDGFVTSSRLNSQITSEETYNTSDENAVLVRKFQTENKMQVRVPTENLGDFLTLINDKKLFLNSRTITAEDVTANAKIAELETQKLQKTGAIIEKIKNDDKKVNLTEDNLSKNNLQQITNLNLADNLKYSTVDIFLKEPKLRTSEIAVTNTENIDNKYKFNFIYDIKNAFVEGFYLIQKIAVGLVTIWPLVLIGGLIFYFLRKRKQKKEIKVKDISENN